MAVLEDIGTRIQSAGYGTLGTNLFLGLLPDKPDHAVCIYEYRGFDPDETMGGNGVPVLENVRIQVVVRDTDANYATAKTKAMNIWKNLSQVQDTTLSGTRYLHIRPMSSPYLLDRDEEMRGKIICNYLVVKEIDA